MTKLFITAHALRAGGGVSVGKNFLAAMVKQWRNVEFWITVPEGFGYEEDVGRAPNVHYLPFQKKHHIDQWLYENLRLPKQVRAIEPDVVIGLANRALSGLTVPQVMLIHDPHLFYPEKHYAGESRYKKLLKAFQGRRFARDLRRIQALMVQTATAEQRIRKQFGYQGTVIQIPNAISKKIALSKKKPLSQPNGKAFKLFYLTRYYPHKNIEALVELFAKYPLLTENCQLTLTIHRNQSKHAARLLDNIKNKGLHTKIRNLGPINQEDIAKHFSDSDCLLMPTTLESFSGTYIEAMACGTPILTSDLDFAREICGEAALYFDPWDIQSIADTLARVMESSQLRAQLAESGRQRLQSLTWSWEENVKTLARFLNDADWLSENLHCNNSHSNKELHGALLE